MACYADSHPSPNAAKTSYSANDKTNRGQFGNQGPPSSPLTNPIISPPADALSPLKVFEASWIGVLFAYQ
jgi:hypothetical protein